MNINSFAGDVGDSGELLVRSDWRDFAHPSTAIVETTAAATDRTFDQLPPLQAHVRADALDDLLTADGGTAVLSFVYDGRLELWSQ